METVKVADNLKSTIQLYDGLSLPMFGLGVYRIEQDCK